MCIILSNLLADAQESVYLPVAHVMFIRVHRPNKKMKLH